MGSWEMWGLAALLAISVALGVWCIGSAAASVPQEDRTYLDPPPPAFRLGWWVIHPISFALDEMLPTKYKAKLAAALRLAGMEFQISPSQFFSARVVCAAALAGLTTWFCTGFALPAVITAWAATLLALGGFALGGIWLGDRIKARKKDLQRAFPFFLDIIVLCVEAGLNFNGALQQACAKGPQGVMQDELRRVVRDLRAGKSRTEALRDLADRVKDETVSSWVSTVIQAEQLGVSLGPALRAQADHKRVERFLKAEEMAMKAPVKMLLPLVVCIFPCTGIILMFPVAMQLLAQNQH